VGLFEFTNPENVPCADQALQRLFLHDGNPPECGFINKGFVNHAGCALNLFYWNGTSEELVAQMDDASSHPIPRGREYFGWHSPVHYEGTYLTHRFYARLPDGTLIQERRVGRVHVPHCPHRMEETMQPEAPAAIAMTFPVYDYANYSKHREHHIDMSGEPLAQYAPPLTLDVIGDRISWLVGAGYI
jgi:hypothetical protein